MHCSVLYRLRTQIQQQQLPKGCEGKPCPKLDWWQRLCALAGSDTAGRGGAEGVQGHGRAKLQGYQSAHHPAHAAPAAAVGTRCALQTSHASVRRHDTVRLPTGELAMSLHIGCTMIVFVRSHQEAASRGSDSDWKQHSAMARRQQNVQD